MKTKEHNKLIAKALVLLEVLASELDEGTAAYADLRELTEDIMKTLRGKQ